MKALWSALLARLIGHQGANRWQQGLGRFGPVQNLRDQEEIAICDLRFAIKSVVRSRCRLTLVTLQLFFNALTHSSLSTMTSENIDALSTLPAPICTDPTAPDLQVLAPLTLVDRQRLAEYEGQIAKIRFNVFVTIGTLLLKIKNGQLFRADYPTFDDYCLHRWGYHKSQAYRLTAAAELLREFSPIGETLPEHEGQIRPLLGLSKETALAVWRRAKELAKSDHNQVTVKYVKLAKAELLKSEKPAAKRLKQNRRPNRSTIVADTLKKLNNLEVLIRSSQSANVQLEIAAEIKNNLQLLRKNPGKGG